MFPKSFQSYDFSLMCDGTPMIRVPFPTIWNISKAMNDMYVVTAMKTATFHHREVRMIRTVRFGFSGFSDRSVNMGSNNPIDRLNIVAPRL